jgi:hypothetical protein
LRVDGSYYRGICGPPGDMVSSLGRICNHRVLYTGCIIRQEYSEGPDNIDLRFPPLSPTAVPVIVHQNSVYVSLSPLHVRLPLILVNPNPGIVEPLLISEHIYG